MRIKMRYLNKSEIGKIYGGNCLYEDAGAQCSCDQKPLVGKRRIPACYRYPDQTTCQNSCEDWCNGLGFEMHSCSTCCETVDSGKIAKAGILACVITIGTAVLMS